MHGRLTFGAAVAAACAVIAAPAGSASADETAQEVLSRLQRDGYTVTIDRIGTGPMDHCKVTGVRNPQQMTQLLPYVGPGNRDGTTLFPVISRTISVSLDCSAG